VRIALIASPWLPVPPPAYGGTEAVIDRLARGFQAAGHEVALFTTGDSTCPVPSAWTYDRSRFESIGNGVVEMRHLMDSYDTAASFDIVHDHTTLGPVYSQRFVCARVATTVHGEFTPDVVPVYRRLDGQVSIIAVSHDQAHRAQGLPIARVIHHGIDVNTFPFSEGGEHLLFLGRMTPAKGVREAIVVARRAGLPLKIAAKRREPSEIDYFEHYIRPLLGGSVEDVGEVGCDDKLALLAGASALINPIQWPEPFGLVMAEALACGTPVLTFRSGAAPEIVDHGRTGFLCNDVTDMVAKLDRVGELDRAACRTAAEVRFSTDRMVADHLELFAEMLGRDVIRPPFDPPRVEVGAA
jgi:glycosyltransferase involved in cell wall biosynthesis